MALQLEKIGEVLDGYIRRGPDGMQREGGMSDMMAQMEEQGEDVMPPRFRRWPWIPE